MKPEFEPGDEVTFKPYEDAIPARVVEISPSPMWGEDNRVWYHLEGTNPRKPLKSICTGRSIMESTLYSDEIETLL